MSALPEPGHRLEFFRDPAEFLAVAGGYLAADPVVSTVLATIAHRTVATIADGVAQPERNWWLAVLDRTGAVVGAGMRTAPFEPYPAFLLPMPDGAAVALARAVHERGEELGGINGALPTVQLCAAELARLSGGRVESGLHTRLHELGRLIEPTPVPGRLVLATEDDLELATAWFAAFMGDADEQAGRERGTNPHELPSADDMLRRLRGGQIWFWNDESGEPVHLTAANPPSFGVARIGPVYTPPDKRGHGYASNGVAAVSRLLLADGVRVCLYTDQANPTSNKIYEALGYRAVVDQANLLVVS